MDKSDYGKKRSISGVIGLVIAITGLVLSPVPIVNNFAFVLALIAIIFAIVGLVKTKGNKMKGRNTAIVALVIGVLAGAIVLGSQAFYGNEINKLGKDLQTSTDKASGKKTNELLGKELDVTLDVFSVTPDEYGYNTTSLPVKVTNKTSSTKSYTIQVEAVDQNGTRLAEDTVSVNNLGGKQAQDFKAFQYVDTGKVDALKTAKFKVSTVSQY